MESNSELQSTSVTDGSLEVEDFLISRTPEVCISVMEDHGGPEQLSMSCSLGHSSVRS